MSCINNFETYIPWRLVSDFFGSGTKNEFPSILINCNRHSLSMNEMHFIPKSFINFYVTEMGVPTRVFYYFSEFFYVACFLRALAISGKLFFKLNQKLCTNPVEKLEATGEP